MLDSRLGTAQAQRVSSEGSRRHRSRGSSPGLAFGERCTTSGGMGQCDHALILGGQGAGAWPGGLSAGGFRETPGEKRKYRAHSRGRKPQEARCRGLLGRDSCDSAGERGGALGFRARSAWAFRTAALTQAILPRGQWALSGDTTNGELPAPSGWGRGAAEPPERSEGPPGDPAPRGPAAGEAG